MGNRMQQLGGWETGNRNWEGGGWEEQAPTTLDPAPSGRFPVRHAGRRLLAAEAGNYPCRFRLHPSFRRRPLFNQTMKIF